MDKDNNKIYVKFEHDKRGASADVYRMVYMEKGVWKYKPYSYLVRQLNKDKTVSWYTCTKYGAHDYEIESPVRADLHIGIVEKEEIVATEVVHKGGAYNYCVRAENVLFSWERGD